MKLSNYKEHLEAIDSRLRVTAGSPYLEANREFKQLLKKRQDIKSEVINKIKEELGRVD